MIKNTEEFLEIMIPDIARELQRKGGLPSPEIVNEWADLEARRLYLNVEISPSLVDYIGYYIERWNEEDDELKLEGKDRQEISIYINTIGGEILTTMHICDLIEVSKTKVNTICQSMAYSGGGFILMCGHNRKAYKSSSFLLHSGGMNLGGETHAVFEVIEYHRKIEEDVKRFVLKNSKIKEDEYDKKYKDQWYMTAQEMLQYGIIDEIIGE